MSERLPFYSNCVGWPRPLLPVLYHLIDEGVQITRGTLLRRSELDDPCVHEWYPEKWDYHISYYRLPGHPVYWFVHSSIEFVFATEETITTLMEEVGP